MSINPIELQFKSEQHYINKSQEKLTFNPNRTTLLFSYIRFSTTEQAKGKSQERQMRYAQKVASERGLELDDSLTIKDLGKSGFHQHNVTKGALGAFLEAIEQGKVPPGSILVIESLDRISRADPWSAQAIIAQIINAEITVITAIDGKEYSKKTIKENSMDLIFIILVFIRAHEESVTKSERAIGTIKQKCLDWLSGKRGFKVDCGKPPKWLKWCKTDKIFIFVPRQKEIMLRKIELFQQGHGGLKIAELLNTEYGEGTVHFTGANVYKEVKRTSLIGEFHVSVDNDHYILRDYYPPILSITEFNQLIEDSVSRAAVKHKQKFVGILSGGNVFKCGECGKSIRSHVIYRNKDVKDVPSSHKTYNCTEASRKNKCNNKGFVYVTAAETAVINYCKDGVNLRRVLSQDNAKTPILESLNNLISQKHEIEVKTGNLVDALANLGAKPKAVVKKLNDLEEQLEEINKNIEDKHSKLRKISTTSSDEVIQKWQELTEGLESLSNDQRQAVRLLVKDTFQTIILHPFKSLEEEGISEEISQIRNQLLETDINRKDYADITLRFHNGLVRVMRINKRTGDLINGFDFT